MTPDKEPADVGVAAPHAYPAPTEVLRSQPFPYQRSTDSCNPRNNPAALPIRASAE